MDKPAELNASILSNPAARRAYYEQLRENKEARERRVKATATLNALAAIAQYEIEVALERQLTPEEVERLRGRVKAALNRI